MKIIQNFSSGKHIKKLPIVDILIWYTGLVKLKSFNYKLKLYCTSADIPFLKAWNLYNFYDEINTTFLDSFFPKIDETNFWSVRKLECINYEFEHSFEPFIYLDTDIILNEPISFTGEVIVWSPEMVSPIYPSWEDLSLPPNYKMPDWLYSTKEPYNCGILGFKTKSIFQAFLEEYYKFTVNNPCYLTSFMIKLPSEKRCVWACNSEQRLLRGFCKHLNLEVCCFMPEPLLGICEKGAHYYVYRYNWRLLNMYKGLWPSWIINNLIAELSAQVKLILAQLPETDLFYFLERSSALKGLYYNETLLELYC
jgi:hypothetical protein